MINFVHKQIYITKLRIYIEIIEGHILLEFIEGIRNTPVITFKSSSHHCAFDILFESKDFKIFYVALTLKIEGLTSNGDKCLSIVTHYHPLKAFL